MPPRIKVTREDIIKTALSLARAGGGQGINARAIATALNCSTQPIFSNFSSMEQLQQEMLKSAFDLYLCFSKREIESGKYPQYKSMGMAYIRFAQEERELFKLLFMRDRTGEDLSPSLDFETASQMIMKANGITIEKARMMHLEMWACVHGIATMLVTSFLPLDTELISDMLTDVYQGVRSRHLSEEN